jgi:hypothetical protein
MSGRPCCAGESHRPQISDSNVIEQSRTSKLSPNCEHDVTFSQQIFWTKDTLRKAFRGNDFATIQFFCENVFGNV